MKKLFVLFSILALLSTCRKSPGPGDPSVHPAGYTTIPPSTPVNTSLMVYVLNNSQYTNPVNFVCNGINFSYLPSFDAFNISSITTDRYNTTISNFNPGTGAVYNLYRDITVNSSARNYINTELLTLGGFGVVVFDNGPSVTCPLPNNGQIVFPPYSFGHTQGGQRFGIYDCYFHPSINDYAVTLPCYPMGDDKGKRWFLNSYGIYLLAPSDPNGLFYPDVNIVLSMPISAAQLGAAPDSIAVWNLNDNSVWQKNGFAHKAGNYYITQVTQKGYWNFAVPVDGIYSTLHLRNTSNIPVLNTRIKLKDSLGEVADVRTDADGNALVFLPANHNLTLDLINDHYNNWGTITLTGQRIGTPASDKTFIVPDRKDMVTIRGNVFNCDGTPLARGSAVLSNSNAKDIYSYPITDGKFQASPWINYYYNFTQIRILDNAGNVLDTTSVVMGSFVSVDGIKKYTVNLYTCANAPELYCNYRTDTTSYSIATKASAASPVLTESHPPNDQDIITIDNNGKGVIFEGEFWTVGGNYFSTGGIVPNLPTGLKVNGIDYQMGPSSEIVITRQDGNIGGFTEGWYSIYYTDSNNVTHNMTGNFRVKRTA